MRSLLLEGDSLQRNVYSGCQVRFLISVSARAEGDVLKGERGRKVAV